MAAFCYAFNMREIEVKAKVRDETLLLKNIAAFGISLSNPISQKDIVFSPKGTAPDAEFIEQALRIRDQDGKIIFTYKKPGPSNHLNKIEIETAIGDAEAMANICKAIGFEEIVRVNKTRQKAEYKHYEICVDKVENLGTFIEIENLVESGDAEAIQEEIFEFMKSLGVEPEDRVFKDYDLLLLNR